MEFQMLAKGIALAGCAIGAGCSLIAGIGPGIGEGNGNSMVKFFCVIWVAMASEESGSKDSVPISFCFP